MAVLLTLASGCSPARNGSEGEQTAGEGRTAASSGPTVAAELGWQDFVRFDGITYEPLESQEIGRLLKRGDLGPKFSEVRHDVFASNVGHGYRIKNGDAAHVKPGTPVYAVRGYDAAFRLAVPGGGGSPRMYEAVTNPRAKEGSDLLDIGGKVRRITIRNQEDIGDQLGAVENPREAESLARAVMDAPVEQRNPDYMGDGRESTYLVVFHLEDGTAAARLYRSDTGRLGSYGDSVVATPETFREAIEKSLAGFLEEQEALREATILEEQEALRTCGDTRKSDDTRVIGRGIPYTTNDVPDGPSAGVLTGTENEDNLAGENGEDEVRGLGGSDTVEGGLCDDEVYGGAGDDYVVGSGAMDPEDQGDDVLHGGPGKDEMLGDAGDDVIRGEDGDDHELYGGDGEDVLYGGEGKDLLVAGGDGRRDRLYCGGGHGTYVAEKIDVVATDCEVETKIMVQGSP